MRTCEVFKVSQKCASISCPIQRDDKGKVVHERRRKTITQHHSTRVSGRLDMLLNCAQLTNKKGDENTLCQFFNFTQGWLASLQCIPVIKSLCILNSDYLSSFSTPHSCSSSYSKDSSSTTPDLTPAKWGHPGVVLNISVNVTLPTAHWQHFTEAAAEAGVFLFHLSLCAFRIDWDTCHTNSPLGYCTPARKREEGETRN